MSKPIDKARAVAYEKRIEKVLGTLIRSGGIVRTRKELIEFELANGGRLEIVQVKDESAVKKAEDSIRIMNRGWVPTGNPNHPETIRYNELKAIVANPPTIPDYRMVKPDLEHGGEFYRVLTKIEYVYATQLNQTKSGPAA